MSTILFEDDGQFDTEMASLDFSKLDDCFDFNLHHTTTAEFDDLDRMFLEDDNTSTSLVDYDFIRFDSPIKESYNPCHGSSRRCINSKSMAAVVTPTNGKSMAAVVTPTKDQTLVSNEAFSSAHFDPLPYKHGRRVSYSEISNAIRADSTPSSSSHSLDQLNGHVDNGGMQQDTSYQDALKKLSDCMTRTDLSRRQISMMKQRTPETQDHVRSQVFASIQQEIQRSAVGDATSTSLAPPRNVSPISEDRTSIMADFFSGSRGTLTNELEYSRRQLKIYAESQMVLSK